MPRCPISGTNAFRAVQLRREEQEALCSEKEMKRRIDATRSVMAECDVSALLVLDGYWEGYSQWMTGTRNVRYIVLFMEGPVYIVERNEDAIFAPFDTPAVAHGINACRVRDIADVPFSKMICANMRLGFIHLEALCIELEEQLKAMLPQAEYIDITPSLDPVKATKSAEELCAIEKVVALHEAVLYALPSVLRAGREIFRIDQDIRMLCQQLGSGTAECLGLTLQVGNSRQGPLSVRGGFMPLPDKRLEWGDLILILLETNGECGHFSALGRYFSLGSPTDEDEKYWKLALKMQDYAAARLKPGARLWDIYQGNCEYIRQLGADTLPRNYLHSLGYCFGEKPFLFDETQDTPLRRDMVYIVHPYVRFQRANSKNDTAWDEMCAIDTYRITDTGGVRQNKVPREIFILS